MQLWTSIKVQWECSHTGVDLSGINLTPSVTLKLETLYASEDAEPEAGPVNVCAISESPSALQLLSLDNAHSCLGKGPQKLPWYL